MTRLLACLSIVSSRLTRNETAARWPSALCFVFLVLQPSDRIFLVSRTLQNFRTDLSRIFPTHFVPSHLELSGRETKLKRGAKCINSFAQKYHHLWSVVLIVTRATSSVATFVSCSPASRLSLKYGASTGWWDDGDSPKPFQYPFP